MKTLASVTAVEAGWNYLSASVLRLVAGETQPLYSDSEETLLVLVAGSVSVAGSGVDEELSRSDPFSEVCAVVYVPPHSHVVVRAVIDSEISIGRAPAEGRFDARVVRPEGMRGILRGGANATRQVVDTFGPQVEAESIVSYEAWVPRGGWAGWPPHRHDGVDDSPYLEETYFYRLDNPTGFGMHRNFDDAEDLDELVIVRDRSLVAVPRGYHLCVAGPSSNMWILNFLAGTPKDRTRPPHFDPAETWIAKDWASGALSLPAARMNAHPE